MYVQNQTKINQEDGRGKCSKNLLTKVDKSAGLEITKVPWGVISSTADVEKN